MAKCPSRLDREQTDRRGTLMSAVKVEIFVLCQASISGHGYTTQAYFDENRFYSLSMPR